MYNVLTDGLPTEYEGYLINYQYYNGILISQCLNDKHELFSNDDFGKLEKMKFNFKQIDFGLLKDILLFFVFRCDII